MLVFTVFISGQCLIRKPALHWDKLLPQHFRFVALLLFIKVRYLFVPPMIYLFPDVLDPGGASYQNKNPFFYQFTCYASGTLGFLITPLAANEDYDWQLYDITGHNPNDIFIDNSLVVTGNWAGTYGTYRRICYRC